MISPTIKKIQKDANFKKYMRIYKAVEGRLDIEANRDEAFSLHASRTSRSIIGKDQFKSRVIYTAIAKDLSYRARLVEIRQRNAAEISLLQGARESLHKYIRTAYRDVLKGYSNEATRSAFLAQVTEDSTALINEANELINLLDFFIKDIDQASHSVRHLIDILKLLDSSKGKVV